MMKNSTVIGAAVILVFCSQSCYCGTQAVNRQTTLTELKAIDGIVSSGLPVFAQGFFVSTTNGPLLVKEQDKPDSEKKKLNPRYYFELPTVIPSGYEGVATSFFNLGSLEYPMKGLVETIRSEPIHIPQPRKHIIRASDHTQSVNELIPNDSMSYVGINEISQEIPGKMKELNNHVIEQATAVEESLPPHLRNPFYSDPRLRNILAKESLPAPGENIVTEWDTSKIQKNAIQSLLQGAGFI